MSFYVSKAGYYELVEVFGSGNLPPEVTTPQPPVVTPPADTILPPSIGSGIGISVIVPGYVAAAARGYVKNLNAFDGQVILDYCGGDYNKFNQIVNAFSATGGNT